MPHKLRHIRDIFETFIPNCENSYSTEILAIGKMLVGFIGQWSFRVCIKRELNTYGVEILCLSDAKTHYHLNDLVQSFKSENRQPSTHKLSVSISIFFSIFYFIPSKTVSVLRSPTIIYSFHEVLFYYKEKSELG